MAIEQMNPFGKMEKSPSWVEMEAARKAAEKAIAEKEARVSQERKTHEETERVRRLLRAEEAKKAGPHVIAEKDVKEAEELVGKN